MIRESFFLLYGGIGRLPFIFIRLHEGTPWRVAKKAMADCVRTVTRQRIVKDGGVWNHTYIGGHVGEYDLENWTTDLTRDEKPMLEIFPNGRAVFYPGSKWRV